MPPSRSQRRGRKPVWQQTQAKPKSEAWTPRQQVQESETPRQQAQEAAEIATEGECGSTSTPALAQLSRQEAPRAEAVVQEQAQTVDLSCGPPMSAEDAEYFPPAGSGATVCEPEPQALPSESVGAEPVATPGGVSAGTGESGEGCDDENPPVAMARDGCEDGSARDMLVPAEDPFLVRTVTTNLDQSPEAQPPQRLTPRQEPSPDAGDKPCTVEASTGEGVAPLSAVAANVSATCGSGAAVPDDPGHIGPEAALGRASQLLGSVLPPTCLVPLAAGMGGTGESSDRVGDLTAEPGRAGDVDADWHPQPLPQGKSSSSATEALVEPDVSGDYSWRSPDDGKEGLLRLHAGGQWWHAVHRTSTERGRVVDPSMRRGPSQQAVNIVRAYKDFDFVGRDAGDARRTLQELAGEYQTLEVWETAEALGSYRLLRTGGSWALVLQCQHCSWRSNFLTAPLELRPSDEARAEVEGMIDADQLVLCYSVDEVSRQLKLLLNLDADAVAVSPPAQTETPADAGADIAFRGDETAPSPSPEPAMKAPDAFLPRHALLRSVQAAFQNLGFSRAYDRKESGSTFCTGAASSSDAAGTDAVGASPQSFNEDDDANWQ